MRLRFTARQVEGHNAKSGAPAPMVAPPDRLGPVCICRNTPINVAWDGVGRRARKGRSVFHEWVEGRKSLHQRVNGKAQKTHISTSANLLELRLHTHTHTLTLRRALLWHRVAAGLSGGGCPQASGRWVWLVLFPLRHTRLPHHLRQHPSVFKEPAGASQSHTFSSLF